MIDEILEEVKEEVGVCDTHSTEDVHMEAYENLALQVEQEFDSFTTESFKLDSMLDLDSNDVTTESLVVAMNTLFKANGFDVKFEELTMESDDVVDVNAVDNKKDGKAKGIGGKLKDLIKKITKQFLNALDSLSTTIKKWYAKISTYLIKNLDKRKGYLEVLNKLSDSEINNFTPDSTILSKITGALNSISPVRSNASRASGYSGLGPGTARAIVSFSTHFSKYNAKFMEGKEDFTGSMSFGPLFGKSKEISLDTKTDNPVFTTTPGGLMFFCPSTTWIKEPKKTSGLGVVKMFFDATTIEGLKKGKAIGKIGNGVDIKGLKEFLVMDAKDIRKEIDDVDKVIKSLKNDVIKDLEAQGDYKYANRYMALRNRQNAIRFKSISAKIGFVNDATTLAKMLIK